MVTRLVRRLTPFASDMNSLSASKTGRFVVYDGRAGVFVLDARTGARRRAGRRSRHGFDPAITGSGRYVTFSTSDAAFLYDRRAAEDHADRVGRRLPRRRAEHANHVAYGTTDDGSIGDAKGPFGDVFVWTRATGATAAAARTTAAAAIRPSPRTAAASCSRPCCRSARAHTNGVADVFAAAGEGARPARRLGERERRRRGGRGHRARAARPARGHARRRRGHRRPRRRQGPRAARLPGRRRAHERAARRPRGARRLAVHALRRRAQGQPPVVRRRGAARAGRAALRALPRPPRRPGRRVRRPHAGRARQRRPGDDSARVSPAMPPEERLVVRFAAEPPQEMLPSGRWAETLRAEFMAACLRTSTRTSARSASSTATPTARWAGRTYIPVTARTTTGLDVFGFVSFAPADDDHPEPSDFHAIADFTDETAEANPEWKLDLCDEVIGGWRGEHGRVAAMTLVWGTALTGGGARRHRRAGRPRGRPVRARRHPLHADRPRQLQGRLPGDPPLGLAGQRAGPRIPVRGGTSSSGRRSADLQTTSLLGRVVQIPGAL